jgi:hypothetical protein
VVVQAAEAGEMDSGESEVSDGDEATNEHLQQQYLQGGGIMEGGGMAAAPRPGSFIFFEHGFPLHAIACSYFLDQDLK